MKTLAKCLLITLIFLVATLSILHVDRQGALMYGFDNSISQTLEVFVENKLIFR